MSDLMGVPDDRPPRQLAHFQVTKQHRRFVEFADVVRRHRYIGAFFGAPGLGNTLSARTYGAADNWDQWVNNRYTRQVELPLSIAASRTAVHTPYVGVSPRQLFHDLHFRTQVLSTDVKRLSQPDYDPEMDWDPAEPCHSEMLRFDPRQPINPTGSLLTIMFGWIIIVPALRVLLQYRQ